MGFFADRGYPILLNLNYGTTFKGTCDDVGVTCMPFLEKAHEQGRISTGGPAFDFRLPYVHSIAASGHQWIGASFPTGLPMTRVKHQLRHPSDPACIGSPGTTLAGSRRGLAPIVLWSFLASHSHEAQIERALRCEHLAAYTHQRLLHQEIGRAHV